jgi:NADH-quinone oxidoreductase subunit G
MVGDSALKTIPRGGDKLPIEYKQTMPKDAYAVWNKLNKSIIGTTTGETLDCSACGECTSVCPVGALVGTDFKYTSNAWELEKIPSTCSHCSAGCQIYYEVKHSNISNSDKKIYRVTNEFHYQTICGAGRYGYDFENRNFGKDEVAFKKAVKSLKGAKYLIFDSQITNEEAYILQKLKEKLKFKLINEDARTYGEFLKNYSLVAGKSLYSGDLQRVRESNFIIVVGTAIKHDNPNSRYALNNALKINKGAGIYFHPIEDPIINGLSKNLEFVKYKPLEEGKILYFILKQFGKNLPEELQTYIDSLKLSETIPAIDFEKLLKRKDKFALIVGEDLYQHSQSKELAQIVGLIDKYTDFSVTIIPPKANSIGVSLICNLDEPINLNGKGVGYNVKSNFTISALGDGDFNVPALNQQEGTFVNIDKRVIPLNVALPFNGYTLNDLANVILDTDVKNSIDYTSNIFNKIAFDNLKNYFGNDKKDYRGYLLNIDEVKSQDIYPKIVYKNMVGDIIYRANPVLQFNHFTNKTHQLKGHGGLYFSQTFATLKGVKEGDKVKIITKDNKHNLIVSVHIDNKIDGEISYLSTFDKTIDSNRIFNGYRFQEVKIEKV